MNPTSIPGVPLTALPVQNTWAEVSIYLCVFLPILAGFVVTSRFYARFKQNLRCGLDDWLVLLALPLFWVHAIISGFAIIYGGIGYHVEALSPDRVRYLQKLLFFAQFFWSTSLAFAKASACLFWLRTIAVNRGFRLAAYSIIILSAGFMLTNILTTLLTCQPIQANWDTAVSGAKCSSKGDSIVAVAMFDVSVGITVLMLPLFSIWKSKTGTRNKFALTTLSVFGSLDTIAAIFRLMASSKIDFQGDWTYQLRESLLWTILEPGLAVCLVSMIVVWPLLDGGLSHHKYSHHNTMLSLIEPELYLESSHQNLGRDAGTVVQIPGGYLDLKYGGNSPNYRSAQVETIERGRSLVRKGGEKVVSLETYSVA